MPLRIEIDRSVCIGAGNCIGVAPEVFALDDEKIAVILDAEGAPENQIRDAAWSCPTDAISLFESTGGKSFA